MKTEEMTPRAACAWPQIPVLASEGMTAGVDPLTIVPV